MPGGIFINKPFGLGQSFTERRAMTKVPKNHVAIITARREITSVLTEVQPVNVAVMTYQRFSRPGQAEVNDTDLRRA